MTGLTTEAEANVKSRLMEFCLVLTYRLFAHATLLRMHPILRTCCSRILYQFLLKDSRKKTWKYQTTFQVSLSLTGTETCRVKTILLQLPFSKIEENKTVLALFGNNIFYMPPKLYLPLTESNVD